jgi:hypothetical protein
LIDIEKLGGRHDRGKFYIHTSGILTPILAGASDLADRVSAEDHPTFHEFLSKVDSNIGVLALSLLLVFLLGWWLAKDGQKLVWLTLQCQIDTLANIAFPNANGDLNDRHRVTIFKYNKWCWKRFKSKRIFYFLKQGIWPRSGWLVPVLRSGHTGKNTSTVFLAPDDGKSAEGVAGLCWSCDSGVYRTKLQAITTVSSDENKDKYSKATSMPRWLLDSYLAEGRPLARALLAYPVQTRLGKRWGVIVLDSQDRLGIDEAVADAALRTIIEPVGVLLEGV